MSGIMQAFEPAVSRWFESEYAAPSPPQVEGWPHISQGRSTLIMAPTGSGKTLAAFLWSINQLHRELAAGREPVGVHTLYISPLKALSYDIEHNLQAPLAGIRLQQKLAGQTPSAITMAVRTGDTRPSSRAAMVRRPPHILVTTPESLFLILSSPKARDMLRAVKTVILDEIHALCGNKRGTHLALSLERLRHLCGRDFVRIGLSATQRPLAEVARFLGGCVSAGGPGDEPRFREVTVVDAGGRKALDLEVITPVADFTALREDTIWPELLPKLLELIRAHHSTLVFVTMRAQAERIARDLNELAEEPLVRVHHGSISHALRREVETQLKAGQVRGLVATGTLELGIDVGAVDLVVQLQSPGEVSRGLQRVGRAGHRLDRVSHGRLFATFREDLVACTVIAQRMKEGWVEATRIPAGPLDVLAQHVAAAAALDPWNAADLWALCRHAHPYRRLGQQAFESVLDLLAGRFAGPGHRAWISWDRATGRIGTLRGALPAVLRNSGAIPDSGYFGLYLPDGATKIGELEEEFVYETVVGDAIQFGNSTWRVEAIDRERVTVTPAPGAPARMPFWKGGLFGRDYELGEAMGAFRRELAQRAHQPDAEQWLRDHYPVDAWSARNLAAYLRDGLERGGAVPTDRTVVVEYFADELGDHRVAILSCFGGQVHAPLALALRRRIREKSGIDPQVLYDDDAILIRMPAEGAAPPPDVLDLVAPERVRELVVAELSETPLFGTLFRQNASRALVLTGRRPKRTPLWLQRLRAQDLMEAVRDQPDHPVRLETFRECLQDRMDIDRLVGLLTALRTGELELVQREVKVPSAMTLGALHRFMGQYMYEYDEPRAERRLRRLQLNRELLDEVLGEGDLGELLEPDVMRDLEDGWQHTGPRAKARDVEELFGVLQRLGELDWSDGPEGHDAVKLRCAPEPAPLVTRLIDEGRACVVRLPPAPGDESPGRQRLVPAEQLNRLRLAYHPEEVILLQGTPPPSSLDDDLSPAGARRARVLQCLAQRGPVDVRALANLLGWPQTVVTPVLDHLARDGEIRRGHYRRDLPEPQVVHRRNLEAIHRRTLAFLRKQVRPCSPQTLQAFLLEHQHLAPGTRLLGEAALPIVVEQLAGRLVPVEVLEREVIPARFGGDPSGWRSEWLDRAVASGEVVWCGLPSGRGRRRRVALCFREDLDWLRQPVDPPGHAPRDDDDEHTDALDADTGPVLARDLVQVRQALGERGASFVFELTAATGLEAARVVPALWELTWRGEVTNDHVQTLRAAVADGFRPPASVVNPYTRRASRSGRRPVARRSRRPSATGRWSLLPPMLAPDARSISSADPGSQDVTQAEQLAWQLLRRYGVVTRDLLLGEQLPLRWGRLYDVLRRLEFTGEVRRGLFVEGLAGAQFALPEVVEALRRLRDVPHSEAPVLVNACDPALLPRLSASAAPWLADAGFSRVGSSYVVVEDGAVTLWAEQYGRRVHLAPDLAPAKATRAARGLATLAERPPERRAVRRLEVELIDGQPSLNADRRPSFEAAGFHEQAGVLRFGGFR